MTTTEVDSAPEQRVCPQCGNATPARLCPIDGWETIPESRIGAIPAPPADVLGRWQASALITREGSVTVWGGRDSATGSAVRIVVIGVSPAADLAEVARAQRAAKALESLQHPHVAKTLATGLDARGDLVVVTEAVSGTTLAEVLSAGALGLARTARIGAELFDALEAAHVAGVMHHDLSPDRIRVVRRSGSESLVVQDLGIADIGRMTSGGRDIDPTQLRPGTARYRAPELSRDRAVTRHADLYAAGAILYEAIAGRPVFDERTAADYLVAHLVKQPARPRADGRELTGPVVELILKCLEKKPWNRPESAASARDVLRGQSGDAPPPVPTVIVAKSLEVGSRVAPRPKSTAPTAVEVRVQEAPTLVPPTPTRTSTRHTGPVPTGSNVTAAPALGATPASPPVEPARIVRVGSEPMVLVKRTGPRPWLWVAALLVLAGGAVAVWQMTTGGSTTEPNPVVASQAPPLPAPIATSPRPIPGPAVETATRAAESATVSPSNHVAIAASPEPAAPVVVPAATDEPLRLDPIVEADAPKKPAKPAQTDSAVRPAAESTPLAPPSPPIRPEPPPIASAQLRAMIVTEPSGATVKVDGRTVGKTPMTVSWEDGDDPEIELSLAGYEPAALSLERGSANRMLKLALVAAREPVKPPPAAAAKAGEPGTAAAGDASTTSAPPDAPPTEPPQEAPKPSLLERGWRPR